MCNLRLTRIVTFQINANKHFAGCLDYLTKVCQMVSWWVEHVLLISGGSHYLVVELSEGAAEKRGIIGCKAGETFMVNQVQYARIWSWKLYTYTTNSPHVQNIKNSKEKANCHFDQFRI